MREGYKEKLFTLGRGTLVPEAYAYTEYRSLLLLGLREKLPPKMSHRYKTVYVPWGSRAGRLREAHL